MRDLNDIREELSKYESELTSITRTEYKSTPFMPGQLDGWSDDYTVEQSLDPSRSQYLKGRIASLKEQIANYSKNAEDIRIHQEKVALENEKWRGENIVVTSETIYKQKMDDYMSQNFWNKAKTIFAGKKPKKMNQQQILNTYGDEAVSNITNPAIEKLLNDKNAQLEAVQKEYANDPKMLEHAIKETHKFFDGEISRLKAVYNSTNDELNKVGIGR